MARGRCARWPRGRAVGLAATLLLGGCSDRTVEEDEPPVDIDIEGICHEWCVRVMECIWTPESSATFDSVEGCESNCRGDRMWSTTCDVLQAEKFECYVSYDCPEFATLGTDLPGGRCHDEYYAWSACVPGEPK